MARLPAKRKNHSSLSILRFEGSESIAAAFFVFKAASCFWPYFFALFFRPIFSPYFFALFFHCLFQGCQLGKCAASRGKNRFRLARSGVGFTGFLAGLFTARLCVMILRLS